eukprot:GHVT01091216.1.p1 GENE.GHVT01091216.1~~GHVT01091216.1.p1  ORF type:complete len:610 (-),score=155.72 GHVT01091216.1:654-2483(-)
MAESFSASHPKSPRLFPNGAPRPLRKLLKQSAKAKHVLSASQETVFFAEAVLPDVDFSKRIDRALVEQIIEKQNIKPALKHIASLALDQGNSTMADLDGVEVLGGAWRVPALQEFLTNEIFTPLPLGQHLNGDEAMAMGAAFIAANYSATFRAKKILMSDIAVHSYSVDLSSLGSSQFASEVPLSRSTVLLKPQSRLFGSKTLAVRTAGDFQVDLRESGNLIATYAVTGVKEAVEKNELERAAEGGANDLGAAAGGRTGGEEEGKDFRTPRVSLVFKIGSTGIIKPSKAFASFEVVVPSNSKGEEQEQTAEKNEPTPPTAGDNQTNEQPAAATTTVKQVPLDVSTKFIPPLPLDEDTMAACVGRLSSLSQLDRQFSALSERRNMLESQIYSSRSWLSSDEFVETVTTKEFVEKLRATLNDMEDWLYEEGMKASYEAIDGKLSELLAAITPIKERAKEFEQRPAVIAKMNKELIQQTSRLAKIRTNKNWVDMALVDAADANLKTLSEWWTEVKNKQDETPNEHDPVYNKKDSYAKLKTMHLEIKAIESIPKPTTTTTTTTATTLTAESSSGPSDQQQTEKPETNEADKNENKVDGKETEQNNKTEKKEEL